MFIIKNLIFFTECMTLKSTGKNAWIIEQITEIEQVTKIKQITYVQSTFFNNHGQTASFQAPVLPSFGHTECVTDLD